MDEKRISVKLIGPAKVNGIREPVGKTVSVTPKIARQLAAAGVIRPFGKTFDAETPLASDFDKAVATEVDSKERQIRAELDAVLVAASQRADAAEARVAELEAQIAPDVTNTARVAAKPTSRKT